MEMGANTNIAAQLSIFFLGYTVWFVISDTSECLTKETGLA